jgi:hypothetical protein
MKKRSIIISLFIFIAGIGFVCAQTTSPLWRSLQLGNIPYTPYMLAEKVTEKVAEKDEDTYNVLFIYNKEADTKKILLWQKKSGSKQPISKEFIIDISNFTFKLYKGFLLIYNQTGKKLLYRTFADCLSLTLDSALISDHNTQSIEGVRQYEIKDDKLYCLLDDGGIYTYDFESRGRQKTLMKNSERLNTEKSDYFILTDQRVNGTLTGWKEELEEYERNLNANVLKINPAILGTPDSITTIDSFIQDIIKNKDDINTYIDGLYKTIRENRVTNHKLNVYITESAMQNYVGIDIFQTNISSNNTLPEQLIKNYEKILNDKNEALKKALNVSGLSSMSIDGLINKKLAASSSRIIMTETEEKTLLTEYSEKKTQAWETQRDIIVQTERKKLSEPEKNSLSDCDTYADLINRYNSYTTKKDKIDRDIALLNNYHLQNMRWVWKNNTNKATEITEYKTIYGNYEKSINIDNNKKLFKDTIIEAYTNNQDEINNDTNLLDAFAVIGNIAIKKYLNAVQKKYQTENAAVTGLYDNVRTKLIEENTKKDEAFSGLVNTTSVNSEVVLSDTKLISTLQNALQGYLTAAQTVTNSPIPKNILVYVFKTIYDKMSDDLNALKKATGPYQDGELYKPFIYFYTYKREDRDTYGNSETIEETRFSLTGIEQKTKDFISKGRGTQGYVIPFDEIRKTYKGVFSPDISFSPLVFSPVNRKRVLWRKGQNIKLYEFDKNNWGINEKDQIPVPDVDGLLVTTSNHVYCLSDNGRGYSFSLIQETDTRIQLVSLTNLSKEDVITMVSKGGKDAVLILSQNGTIQRMGINELIITQKRIPLRISADDYLELSLNNEGNTFTEIYAWQ